MAEQVRAVIVTGYDAGGTEIGHTVVDVLTTQGPRAGTPEQATSNGLTALLEHFGERLASHTVEYRA